jgi:hypothetical protein
MRSTLNSIVLTLAVILLRITTFLVILYAKTLYRARCIYWDWRIPSDINLYIKRWGAIDRRKDKSLSTKDFRQWYYLRKIENQKL